MRACRRQLVFAKLFPEAGKTKVENPCVPVAVNHDVLRFQIAVENPNVVGRSESSADLASELNRLVYRQAADAAEQGREFFALDVLHRKKMAPISFADVVNAADVFVTNLTGDADFTVKAGECGAIAQQMLRQKL